MKLIVWEKLGTWAAALRTLLPAGAPSLVETRTPEECLEELAAAPTSFLVIELTSDGAAQRLESVVALRRRFPAISVACVAVPRLQPWQQIACEAGACMLLTSQRDLPQLVESVLRHAARVPRRPDDVAEQIWAELPLAT